MLVTATLMECEGYQRCKQCGVHVEKTMDYNKMMSCCLYKLRLSVLHLVCCREHRALNVHDHLRVFSRHEQYCLRMTEPLLLLPLTARTEQRFEQPT